MKNVWAYLRVFSSDWVAVMSGGASLLLAALAHYLREPVVPAKWLWIAAALCFILASYKVWEKEHVKVIELESLEHAPQVIIEYEYSVTTHHSVQELASQMSCPLVL